MSDIEIISEGLGSLQKMLKEMAEKADSSNIERAMEKGAQALIRDVRALPKPRSKITKSGYTHLLDSVAMRKNKGEIEVGWGKYYGPMVEYLSFSIIIFRYLKAGKLPKIRIKLAAVHRV